MADGAASSGVPRFSVVVPTRNRPLYLAEAIESIRAQTLSDFEIVVVDDHGDVEITLPDDDRIRILRLDHRHGPAGAFNAGVAAAVGEIVTFCADDDWWLPNRLELAEAGLSHAPVAMCFVRYSDEAEDSKERPVPRGWIGDKVMDRGWTPGMAGMALHRECWLGLDERYPAAEDTEFALRLCTEFPIWTVPEYGYLVRRHDEVRDIHGPLARVQGMRMLLEENAQWFEAHRSAHAFRLRRIGLTYASIGHRRDAARVFWESLRTHPSPAAARDLARVLGSGSIDAARRVIGR